MFSMKVLQTIIENIVQIYRESYLSRRYLFVEHKDYSKCRKIVKGKFLTSQRKSVDHLKHHCGLNQALLVDSFGYKMCRRLLPRL